MENEKEKQIWEKIIDLIEEDMIQAHHSCDLDQMREISEQAGIALKEIQERTHDLRMQISEKRANVLAIVFSYLTSVTDIRWHDDGWIVITSGFLIPPEVVSSIKDDIRTEFQVIDISNIMTEPEIKDDKKLTWRWVV